jgi:hypothetical protein
MNEFSVEVDGKYPIAQIELQIQSQEAGGSEFIQSSIAYYNHHDTNIVQFRMLSPGNRPKRLWLVQGSPTGIPPAGTRIVWSGKMMVQNTPQPVSAFRQI